MRVSTTNPSKFNSNEEFPAALARLRQRILAHATAEGKLDTPIPGIWVALRTAVNDGLCGTYEPELVVFSSGEKRIENNGSVLHCRPGQFLLTSVDIPVRGQITHASVEEPFSALVMRLEMPLIREILSQDESLADEPVAPARGMVLAPAPIALLDSCTRLLELLDRPAEIEFLAPLIKREIHYRILRSASGRHLRAIATLGDQSNRTARAVAWLRTNYAKPLRVEELAEIAQMGLSTFHHRFRSLTQMSPVQFQKRLRLQQARFRMMTDGLDAASAAFEVGYESPSQFSREYSRMFGQPPMRDVKTMRIEGALSLAE